MKTFLTQRRQGARKKQNSENLSAFAPLRDISCLKSKRRDFVRHPIRDALDAILDEVLSEVDEQTESFVLQPQIREHLLAVDWVERRDRFHFHEHAIIDDEVGTKTFIERDSIPCDWNRDLSFHQVTVFAQFMCEGNFVDDLENASPEPSVEPVGSIDDQCCDFIFFHALSFCFPGQVAKQKITQRRQGAKKGNKFPNLSAFAPLRDTFLPA